MPPRIGPRGYDPPPILIAGDSDAALRRAARTIEASDIRIADLVDVEVASERIDGQIAASALWMSSAPIAAHRWTGCWTM